MVKRIDLANLKRALNVPYVVIVFTTLKAFSNAEYVEGIVRILTD